MKVARWLSPARLAGPMSRSPILFAGLAVLVAFAGATGLTRYGVDAGQDLLVGGTSPANQTYQKLVKRFGSDPIVIVFAARNPTAFYREGNILRLSALEDDLNHDPRVASALGPGTVANSLVNAAHQEEVRLLNEYGTFIAELAYLNGVTDSTKLQQAKQTAEQIFSIDVFKAAVDAENARQQEVQREQSDPRPTDRLLDTEELAAEAAVAKDVTGPSSLLPPAFAQFLNYKNPDTNAANQLFKTVTAAYGDCDPDLASLVAQSVPNFKPTCKYLIYRALLDLPKCPLRSEKTFCQPKREWAAVLPPPDGAIPSGFPDDCSKAPVTGCSYAVLTIRLKPGVAENRSQVDDLLGKIDAALTHGIPHDDYISHLSTSQLKSLDGLNALQPTECGRETSQTDKPCFDATNNAPLSHVVAGAAPLAFAVADGMQRMLYVLAPVALFLMLILLIGTFRVRGRIWPLASAVCATVLTVGAGLWLGTPLSPAVLAGIPVLVGLGVDYAVQLVARYAEERGGGADAETAARMTLGRTGPATLLAAVATIAGLLGLGLATGVDGGPFVAIPLIAEFAMVVAGGVILSWFAGIFVAMPLAIASDRRGHLPVVDPPAPAVPHRTLSLAGRPARLLVPALLLGLLGWVLLPSTAVETDSERLLAPTLPELQQINLARDQAGYANEIDVLLEGQVAGPYSDAKAIPDNVVFQCQLGLTVLTTYPNQVAATTSIADFFSASRTSATKENLDKCTSPAQTGNSASSGSTPASPSPGAATGSPGPSPTSSPTARRPGDAVLAARQVTGGPVADVSPGTSPAAGSPSSTPSPGAASPGATPTAIPGTTGAGSAKVQTTVLCDLRLFPLLARALVMDIPADAQACPGVDRFQNVFLTSDSQPIDPTAARVVVGMRSSSVADEAQVVDGIRGLQTPPGITAAPTGLAALAAQAYDAITGRSLLLNLLPLMLVALVLFVVVPHPRRAVLALLPTALAAGWAPLLVRTLGLLPGTVGHTLGTLNPLTVVLGALVVALGTEFSVVLLGRFYEELERTPSVEAAAAAALGGVGRAIRVSALTLGGGFAVLALSGLLPNSLPLLSDFGLAVLLDLGLAVAAVFLVMFPLAIAWERAKPIAATVNAGGSTPVIGIFALTPSQQVSVFVVGFLAALGVVVLGVTLSPLCYLALLPLVVAVVGSTAGAPVTAPRPAPAVDSAPPVREQRPRSTKAARRRGVPLVRARTPVRLDPPAHLEEGDEHAPELEPAANGLEPAPAHDAELAAEAAGARVEPRIEPDEDAIPPPGAGEEPSVEAVDGEPILPVAPPPARSRRVPGVSGRRRQRGEPEVPSPVEEAASKRRPGVSGRRRRPAAGAGAAEDSAAAYPQPEVAATSEAAATEVMPPAETPPVAEPRRSKRRRPPPGVRRRRHDQPPMP